MLLTNMLQGYFFSQNHGVQDCRTADMGVNTAFRELLAVSGEMMSEWRSSAEGMRVIRAYLDDERHTVQAIEAFVDFDGIATAFREYQKTHYH